MKRQYRIACLAFLLTSAAPLVFAAGLPPQYAGTPTAKEYPKADVLVLSDSHAFTLAADGRVTEKVRRVEKILTYQGMDEAGDPHAAFNKENQDLAITLCRTYTPEGRVADAKKNSFNEMTPFELEKAPAYTSWRQMVITKVALDINAVVELEYTLADTKPWRRGLEGFELLQDAAPALVREVSVTLPDGTPFIHKLFGWDVQPAVTKSAGTTTYTWTLKNVPGVDLTQAHGLVNEYLPTLVFTTAPDWKHNSDFLGKALEKAAATSPLLDKKVEDLVKGTESPFERIVKVHSYVAENINTIEWPLSDFDYAPRAAGEIYLSGYGHALDKAVLLAAMLRKLGFDPAVALCHKGVEGGLDPAAVPCLSQMDRTLVRVEDHSRVLWLDPTAKLSEASQRDFQGYKGLPCLPGYNELHAMTPIEGAIDSLSANLDAKATEDLALEGEGMITMAGWYSPYYKVQGSKDSQKETIEGLVSSMLPGATVTDFSVVRMEPGQVVFKVSFKAEAPKPAKPVKALKTGLPEGSLLKGFDASYLKQRDLPLVLESGGQEKISLKITLPEGLKPSYVPKDAKVENAAGAFGQAWAFKDGVLEMKAEAKVPKKTIPAKDYPDLKALYGLANATPQRAVIF